MAKRKSLSDQLLELTTAKPKEIDPESELDYSATWRKGGDYDEPADNKPEVPQTRVVGKSLRDIGNLGSKYSGKRTSRKDLEQKQEELDEEDEFSSDDEASKRFTGVFDDEGEKMVKAYGKKYDKLLKELEIDDEDEDEDEEGVEDDQDEEEEEDELDEEADEDEEGRSDLDEDEEEEEEQSEEQIKSATLDEADKLMQQLQQEEEEQDRETLETSLKVLTKKEDTEKANNTKNQRVLWDSFLDVRIRLQKGITAANRLPQFEMLDEFKKSDPRIAKSTNVVVNQLNDLLHKLQGLKENLIENNSEMSDVSDSIQNSSKKRKLDEQMSVDDWWDVISHSDESLKSYEEDNIDKWYKRSLLASGNAILEKKFKAVNQSIMTQVNHVLNDSAKLRKKSQLKRTAFTVLGKPKAAVKAKGETHNIHLNDYDEEIYDDTDFYQQLLKELIETTTDNDSMHVTQYWLENQHLRRKMKKAVEKSASKGRKLKYEVHDKLVGFMAPKNDTALETLAWRPSELYANLFGGQNKELR